jgi:hypothetical protein
MSLTVSISDEGLLTFKDSNGNQVSDAIIETAKKQQGDTIKALIQGKCDELNAQIESLGEIHHYTSPPLPHLYSPSGFADPFPVTPVLKKSGFFCRWFKFCVAKVDASNRQMLATHLQLVDEWQKRKNQYESQVLDESDFLDRVNAGDKDSIEKYFERVLLDIQWPRETMVSFELHGNTKLVIDLDLPEIEDMPTKTAAVPQRGFRLSVKELGATQIQKLYMRHIHALGLRITGEAFAASPLIEEVVVSGYSQRANRATGVIGDEYLYSVRVNRQAWAMLNFDNLHSLDAAEALERFDLRRDMSKSGVFRAIQPFTV